MSVSTVTPTPNHTATPTDEVTVTNPVLTDVPAATADGAPSTLDLLEAEGIAVIREAVGESRRPVLLFSGGKDSVVMLHLARKAFWPAPIPFPVLHVDTGHNFPEVIDYRDAEVERLGLRLDVASVQDWIDDGRLEERPDGTRNPLQTLPLLDAIERSKYDAVFGGGRRDEEKARAKERIVSLRDEFGQWDPRNQRPELWHLLNARHRPGEHVRVFPLSNWTELDIWQYIYLEGIPIVPLYFAAEREVIEKNGTLLMIDDDRILEHLSPEEKARIHKRQVRFRTLGCYPLTGAVESQATTLTDIIQEMLLTRTSERQGRVIDHDGAGSMEEKKRQGYF